ncbi:MAG: tetratricopeptide repeat protein [Paludibacteraceae bacterium]|nr:tetratricopeptide repeat protein [Paludibacteraceae bacterium]
MYNHKYKHIVLALTISLLGFVPVHAVTQQGYVKTIARPNRPSERIEGVLIRVQGAHNAVQSRENGEFTILLSDMQNGDPYAFSRIYRSGYVLAEQELIGKQMACSDKVPLAISLVNQAELLREKQAIADKAIEQAERAYAERNEWLEQQLAAHVLSEQEYNRRLNEMVQRYDRFGPLVDAMAETYARTDLDNLDELSASINAAIEAGDYEQAERLMMQKESLDEREQRVLNADRLLASAQAVIDSAQLALDNRKALNNRDRREVANDLYRMYSICLMRFDNDSARLFIERRAQLDTLNIDYQLQAGQFVKEIMRDYPAARTYFERAYRIAETQYGEQSGQMATTCNELALLCKWQGRPDDAFMWGKRSLTIREQLTGKNSIVVAEALSTLGELYRARKDRKNTLDCHKRALRIREKHLGSNNVQTATSKGNIAGVYVQENKNLVQALKLYKEVYAVYSADAHTPKWRVADVLNNLGVVAYKTGNYAEAQDYMEQAVAIYREVLGNSNPKTLQAETILNAIKQK